VSLIDNNKSQAEIIAKALDYDFKEITYGNSHIKEEQHLALATLSKYPIKKSYFHKLPNPNLTMRFPDGKVWESFDVGFLTVKIDYKEKPITVANCHLVPFHYFKRDFAEPAFQDIRDDISEFMVSLKDESVIVGGDFNYNNLRSLLPTVFESDQYNEVFEDIETRPGRGQQDHILYSSQWNLSSYEIKKADADHYLCIADFDLK
jgi:endonuclease/exonuclease/phosphatase (EEP) superfamily protein YafD